MAEIRRNTRSPVAISISTPKSPSSGRCISGRECLRAQARAKSAEERERRNLVSGTGYLDNHLLCPPSSGFRSRSCDRPDSARRNQQQSFLLDIPSIRVNDVSTDNAKAYKNGHSGVDRNTSRSRSSSPFDWITREKLPCGSPTFEMVMCDMLSDTEISPRNSDTENSGDATKLQSKKKISKRPARTTQKISYKNKVRSKTKV